MKVGILTFHNTRNYGALMQCYALQKYLKTINVDCEVINYNNKYLMNLYNLNPFYSKNIKGFIKKAFMFPYEYINQKSFENFKQKYITISKIEYNESNIKNADNNYDLFIAGSDQIWNFELSGHDKNYFMEFCNKKEKKNSYAASFGSGKINEQYLKAIIHLLKKQNMISIREKETITYLSDRLSELNFVQCVDPVFLLGLKQWNEFVEQKFENNNYIFVYEVAHTPNLRNYAYYLSKKLNKKVIFLSKSKGNIKNAKKIKKVSPTMFLTLICKADIVLTSSFHGMAFSLIFEKDFLYDLPKNNGEFGSRLKNLAKISGVEKKRIISEYHKCDLTKIDYNNVRINLDKEIKKSKQYLEKIVNERN